MHNNCRDNEIKTVTIHITKNKCASEYINTFQNKTYEIILSEIISQLEFILEEKITKL